MIRFLALLAPLLLAPGALATEVYGERTAQGCGVCHHDPSGGGSLTEVGEAFAAGGHVWPIPEDRPARGSSRGLRVLRFFVGFVHFLTAMIWFGTIFYVHLVLRPTYAKGGLPRTELRIAWASMPALAITGAVLTTLKVDLSSNILSTRWGILLAVKVGLFSFLVLAAGYVTAFLSPRLRRLRADWQANDGQDGRPAWVKVGDQLYDVTESPRWKDGKHFNRHQAGQDLSAGLASAPHGKEKLQAFPCFSLTGGKLRQESREIKILYVMAYVNLAVALGIVVVMSLWKWG